MFRNYKLSVLLQLFILNLFILRCSTTVVNIPQGRIRGIRNITENYKAYLGIPYATVTERFQEPGSPPRWNKTFDAIYDSIYCEQIDRSTLKPVGQKDCLVLNVFTPLKSHERLLPVLIVIPGGGFHFGLNIADTYNPKYLINKDIIVVTINYRLGAFGFLCLQTPKVPGNAGLKDQLAAIRWVKNNIEYFGGNPQSITLFGDSVGAASVSYLLLSSETEGLFQRVIMSSGTLLVPYALDNDPLRTASHIADRMGYKTNDPEKLLKFYQNVSTEDILMASHFNDLNDPFAPYVFRPCIDKSNKSLVKASPKELIASPLTKRNMSIVIGYNNMEGIKWAERYNVEGLKKLNETILKIIPYNIRFRSEKEKSTFVEEIKSFYFKNWTLNSYVPLIQYFSDSVIMYPSVATINYLLCNMASVYNYYFQYDSNRNISKRKTKLASVNGATHSDDLYYAFDPSNLRSVPVKTNDAAMIDAMTSFWSNFVKTGNPSTPEITWIASEVDNLKFLSINNKIEIISLPNKKRIRFWQDIYEKYISY